MDSTAIESKRFLIVPLLSSAARMPLPGATSALAVAESVAMSMWSFAPRNPSGYRPMPTPCDRWSALPSVCSDGATITSAFWNSLRVS